MPWCYTTNATARWEYCTIPSCDGKEPDTPGKNSRRHLHYGSAMSLCLVARNLRWLLSCIIAVTLCNANRFLLFTTAVDQPEQAQATEECYQGNGVSYRGTASFTITGKKCQAWNSMSPHRHNKTSEHFPNAYVHFSFLSFIQEWSLMNSFLFAAPLHNNDLKLGRGYTC